jgi:hypothetical protein
MRGEEDGGPACLEVQNDVLEQVLVDRVEATERLVEDEQLGLVDHRAYELDLLLHALRQILDPPVRPLGEAEALEPREAATPALPPRHPPDLAQEDHQVEGLHLPVDPPLLGQIPDLRAPRARSG